MTMSNRLARTACAAWGRSAATLFALVALFSATSARADESELILPDLASVTFLGMTGRALLMVGILVCFAGPRVRARHVQQAEEPARAQGDARRVRAHLRDVQDVPHHAGQVHPRPGALHRGDPRRLLRRPAAHGALQGRGDPPREPRRDRRELRRRLVRHPHQHVRELAHGLREPQGQALPDLRHSARGRHVDRHDAHLDRAAPHARHPALRPGRLSPAPASSASRSASPSAPRRCASRAASSRRSPTSDRTS